jgi:Putative restriction endonuclease
MILIARPMTCAASRSSGSSPRLVHPWGQADPDPRTGRSPGQQARTGSLCRAGDDPRLQPAPPGPADVGQVVEIADSSLAGDRKYATELYGPARIPVYWIVNLVNRQVEVYSDPGPRGYRSTEVFKEEQSVPVVIGGREVDRIAVKDLLPSRRRRAKAGGNGA